MAHSQSVAVIRGLLGPQNDARPNFLMGAGCSFSSGVPLAGEGVRRLTKQAYSDRVLGRQTLPEHVKTSEWMSWLQNQDWFLHGDDRLAENFPLVIEHLLKPEAYRRRVLLDLVAIEGEIGPGYRAFAELVLRGLAGTALTTNFDLGLPKALNDKQPHIRHVAEVNRGPDDFNEFGLYARAQVIWLHGKAEQYTDRNLIAETQTLDAKLLAQVGPLLESAPLIVVGYRGAEASIMHALLGAESGLRFRNGIYWCVRKGETIHPNVEALARRLGGNFQMLEITGFDELLVDLNKQLAGVQRFADPPSAAMATQFDDQAVIGATWADVDQDLALSTLKRYCEKLERGDLSAAQLRPLMRELGLLIDADGAEQPSVGCILLFGRAPERFFPHAIISATLDGKKRQVLAGNLLQQYSKALEWLEQAEVNPTIKVKGVRKHESRKAYAERALVELLVNLLVHRDYEAKAAASIEVSANASVRFVNPGAQGVAASAQLTMDEAGVFTPPPGFSDLRNRALCDIFFGISAMERAGTGLTDAGELTRKQGGAASFAYPPGRDEFVAELFRPEASAGSPSIAKDTRPVGTYLINMLPFAAMPQSVTWLKVKATWADLEKKTPLHEAGTFLFEQCAGVIWSFAPAAVLSAIFAPVLIAPPEEISLADMEKDDDLRRKLSWLLRRHFEAKLKRFETDGLILERGKNRPAKRAYFRSLNLNNRPIVYDTPAKKNIKRDVVKRRGEEPNLWFECEGFGYEVIRLGGVWGVRIKPFYMFAGRDGVSPLPSYMRASKATRRIRFDRNANVESDLVFWGRYLSTGEQTINIGDQHTGDLLLEGGFYSIDVQEGGLVDVALTQDKRSA